MQRSIALLLLCSALAPAQGRSDWQSIAQLKTGDRVTVSLKARGSTEGTFQSWTTEQITVNSVAIKEDDVARVTLHRDGAWSRGKTALVGAGIGGGVGMAIGVATGGGCGHVLGPCASRAELGGVLAGAGVALGTLIGALIPHHRLDVIYVAK